MMFRISIGSKHTLVSIAIKLFYPLQRVLPGVTSNLKKALVGSVSTISTVMLEPSGSDALI